MSAGPVAATVTAAACFGVASVLQQSGARRVAVVAHFDPMLLLRLARQPPYAIGLLLDVVGFTLSTWALRALPLFVVQAGLAASLAVTALLSAHVLRESLRPAARWAVATTGVGVLLLAASAGAEAASTPSFLRSALPPGVVLVVVLAVAAHRRAPACAGVEFGVLAGAAFAGFALAGRVADLDDPTTAASDPVAWALVGYLLVGALLHGTSLQRGSVTVVTASYVAIEVVIPAAVGLLLLGDAPRPGAAVVAAIGFLLVIAAIVALAWNEQATRSSDQHQGSQATG